MSGLPGDRIAQAVTQRLQAWIEEMGPSSRQAASRPASESGSRSGPGAVAARPVREGSTRSAAPVRRSDGQRESRPQVAPVPAPEREGSVGQAREAERVARGARRDAIRDGAYRIGGVRRSSGRQATLDALRTPTAAQTAIVVSELLGPPRALRPYSG